MAGSHPYVLVVCRAQGSDDNFHIGFTFDSDIPCQFTVFTGVADSIEVDSLGRGKTRYNTACAAGTNYTAFILFVFVL